MQKSKLWLLIAGALGLSFCTLVNAADSNRLFPQKPLLKSSQAYKEAEEENPAAEAINVTVARSNVVADASSAIILDLPNSGEVTAQRTGFETNRNGTQVWRGTVSQNNLKATRDGSESAADAANSVILVRNGDMVTGTVRVNTRLYSIQPMRNGEHAVIEIDQSKLPPEEPQHMSTAHDASAHDSSCYQTWSASQVYDKAGQKVVYNGDNYENKWWTQGDTPSKGGVWKNLGACGTDTATTPTTPTDKTTSGTSCYSAWSSTQSYAQSGSKVSYNGKNYENKWWTKGDNPSTSGSYGAWKDLGACSSSESSSGSSSDDTATPPATGITTLRVLVSATPESKAKIADLNGLAQLAIAESNQGFINSNVPVRYELAGTYTVKNNYKESGDYDIELDRAIAKKDGYMDDLHTARTNAKANIVVVLLESRGYCGVSVINAKTTSAFSMVGRTCATGNYSFSHEIGHLLGATHDAATSTNKYYPYGYGFKIPGQWRTIMAYECPTTGPKCSRVNYWSSPDIKYKGVAMGTAKNEDNVRVLTERAPTAATWK